MSNLIGALCLIAFIVGAGWLVATLLVRHDYRHDEWATAYLDKMLFWRIVNRMRRKVGRRP